MSKRPELFNKVKVIGGLLKGHYGKVVYDLLDGTYKVRIDNDNVYLIDCYNLEVIDGLHSDVDKDQQIADLEAKLAEKDGAEQSKYQNVLELTKMCTEKYKQIEQLKQQLAEKDKEYQSFKKIADENVNYLKNRILEETRNYNQDKISFCIEKLEKVKEKFGYKHNSQLVISSKQLVEFIDNQIKELKGEE